ncbi:hypothetical protein C427_5061 [Paraglaciecola psychrophila 170]|uniref:Uncharacterized protein n=1 Tax=Paraglaciecola psychrophila 170 TaxID=1129794 RepID=K7AW31_9ALTE|nr:hypothetical protein C427_5061 [Paraglaciecola psychrophila 170]GAC39360.1 hypothetical protein GPSY_3749 [Paraglaciecola psychrophila 170]
MAICRTSSSVTGTRWEQQDAQPSLQLIFFLLLRFVLLSEKQSDW